MTATLERPPTPICTGGGVPFYTFGYQGKSPAGLLAKAEAVNALIVDTRYSSKSRNPVWREGALREALGDYYAPIPTFGNVNYLNPGAPICIAHFEAGLERMRALMHEGEFGGVILMCACSLVATCHRRVLADRLIALGWDYKGEVRL
jgi:uncharacterized protein (DUF488 family)